MIKNIIAILLSINCLLEAKEINCQEPSNKTNEFCIAKAKYKKSNYIGTSQYCRDKYFCPIKVTKKNGDLLTLWFEGDYFGSAYFMKNNSFEYTNRNALRLYEKIFLKEKKPSSFKLSFNTDPTPETKCLASYKIDTQKMILSQTEKKLL